MDSVYQWFRRLGFNPRSNLTKDSKNATRCLLALYGTDQG